MSLQVNTSSHPDMIKLLDFGKKLKNLLYLTMSANKNAKPKKKNNSQQPTAFKPRMTAREHYLRVRRRKLRKVPKNSWLISMKELNTISLTIY